MARPTDWYVLDLDNDPVPGDTTTVDSIARTWSTVADDADRARGQINSLLGDQAVMTWIGKSGDAFRTHSSKLPDQLRKCAESYRTASGALTTWSGELSHCQSQADRALALGRAARADLDRATAVLSAAQATASSAGGAANALQHPRAGAPAPDPAQVRSAVARAQAAGSAVAAAQGDVSGAQARLNAAKKMAAEAAGLRDQQGKTTATKLHKAADEGIPPDSFWSKLGSAVSSAWHVVVEVAKVVVAIGGIIALIIGGPLAWIVFAAALIVLADTLMKYAQGRANLLDVGLALISCIPCTKGLTSLDELSAAFRSGGLLGAGAHLLGSTKNAVMGFARTANGLRAGAVVGAKTVFTSFSDAKNAFAEEQGFARFTAAFGKLGEVGSDPASKAAAWQASDARYGGIDAWHNETLPPGYKMEAGYPGVSGFTTPQGTMASVGNDSAAFHDGVQVGPGERTFFGSAYRSEGIRLETTAPVDVATSHALANPQYGAGGLPQHFVPDISSKVTSGQIVARTATGQQIPAHLNEAGHLIFETSAGDLITLHNASHVPPGVPTIEQIGRNHAAVASPANVGTASRAVSQAWAIGAAAPGREP